MNSLIVGGILKRIYNNFDMGTFSNRLKLQKVVYLLQQSGINLGYNFNFYHYGPYCSELAKDGFNIANFDKVRPVGFEDTKTEKIFHEFFNKIKRHKNNIKWLEIASSIHLLRKIYPSFSKNEIVSKICKKRKELDYQENYIKTVWSDIEGWLI